MLSIGIIIVIIVAILIALVIIILGLFAIGFSCYAKCSEGISYMFKNMKKPAITNQRRYQILYDILDHVMAERQEIELWAMDGTLLGFVREGKIICYDYDIDLEVMEKDWDNVKAMLNRIVEKDKRYAYMYYEFKNSKYAQLYDKETMTACDFQVARIKDGQLDDKYTVDDIFPLRLLELKRPHSKTRYYINIPNSFDIVLTKAYGKNYMIPDHRCDQDCENCVKIN